MAELANGQFVQLPSAHTSIPGTMPFDTLDIDKNVMVMDRL